MQKKRRMRTNEMIAVGIALLIVAIFTITLIFPNGVNSTNTTDLGTAGATSAPNAVATPTIAPASYNIEGQAPYISTTGFYQVFQPAGTSWIRFQDNYVPAQDRVNTIFRGNCAVIHDFIVLGVNYDSPQALSDQVFTEDYFAAEWTQYPSWQLTSKTIDGQYVVMDFDLVGRPEAPNCPSEYLGRQISWVDGGLLYNVRLVVRQSDRASLDVLQDLIVPSLIVYANNLDTIDMGWQARFVPGKRTMIMLPPSWQSETTAGQFESYKDTLENHSLTIKAYQNKPLSSVEEAQTWLRGQRSNMTPASRETIEQRFASGYLLSYAFRNPDGDPFSAASALLNDENGTLYIAEIIVAGGGLDLLTKDSPDSTIQTLQSILRSFTILAPQDATNPIS